MVHEPESLRDILSPSRLTEVVEQCAEDSIETMMKTVLDAVEDFSRGAGQADDLTLLIVRYRQVAD